MSVRPKQSPLRANRANVIASGSKYAQVQRVASRIEAVAARDKPAFVWKVTLLRKNVANAYCLPGGKIVVYSGILPLTKNDAGLATVLGHEVAHATAEHVAERIERQHLTEVAAAIVAAGVAFTPARCVRCDRAARSRIGAPRSSRSQESEADHIGLIYMGEGRLRSPPSGLVLGSACGEHRTDASRRSFSAAARATRIVSSASNIGCRKPNAPSSPCRVAHDRRTRPPPNRRCAGLS